MKFFNFRSEEVGIAVSKQESAMWDAVSKQEESFTVLDDAGKVIACGGKYLCKEGETAWLLLAQLKHLKTTIKLAKELVKGMSPEAVVPIEKGKLDCLKFAWSLGFTRPIRELETPTIVAYRRSVSA